MSIGAIGVKVGRPVVPLNDGDCSTWPQELPQPNQRLDRLSQMLQDEADKDMIERLWGKWQSENIGLLKPYIGQTGRIELCFGLRQRTGGNVN
jgi:hypothetical protein